MLTKKTSALVLTILIISAVALAQENQFGNIAERQRTSTVLGGTGMFNTFSTRTLYKGEFNFAAFWNRFNRDPGGLRIDQAPFNFTVGLTNRWELWVDWVAWQKTRSNNPLLLSGYQYNAVRLFGDPVQILGPQSSRGGGAAAFFPGTGVDGGGILPALGRFGTPAGLDGVSTISPGGAGRPLVAGLGPAIITSQANFYDELPFFGVVDFVGFDGLGRPVLGPRESANGSGDVYVGSKYSLIDGNRHWFSMALGGYVKIPISRDDQARARGRTNGEYEYGPMLILGQETPGHRLRFYENVGYIHTGDIRKGDVKVLDLRDKVLLNAAASFALNKHVEFLAEAASTVYVGDGTASLERINPLDLNLGMRFFLRDGSIAFGGGYRYAVNSASRRTLSVLECEKVVKPPYPSPPHTYGGITPPPPPPPKIECKPKEFEFGDGERHGFVGFFSIGTRNGCPPPPVPSCVLEASPAVVTRGDRLTLNARPSTLGYSDAKMTYQYRWEVKGANGRSVSLNGSGAMVEVPTAQLSCGSYWANATVTVTAEGVDHPSGCVTTGESNCTASFEVTEPPCPAVTCSLVASASTVTEGDRVAFRATIAGAGRSTCTWTTTAGRLSSTTGTEVTLSTAGVTGPVTVRAMVATDQRRCDQACPGSSCAATITVQPIPPPQPRPEVIKPCGPIFFPFNLARINNEHKACLDQIPLALEQDPRAALVIDGHRDSSERVGMSLTRAYNARDYLVNEKRVDPARITVRNFGDTCPQERSDPQLNRRVEMWILPERATISDIAGLKRCRAGSAPREITDEAPAQGELVRPSRPKKPEPIGTLAEPDSRFATAGSAATTTRTERHLGPASVVRSVSASMVDGALRVIVDTDGAVQFKDFILTGPSRIVIDLAGVRSAMGSKTIPVAAGLVDRVRVGEPGPGSVRIVIDVQAMARYRVMRDGPALIIIIGDEGAAAGSGGSR